MTFHKQYSCSWVKKTFMKRWEEFLYLAMKAMMSLANGMAKSLFGLAHCLHNGLADGLDSGLAMDLFDLVNGLEKVCSVWPMEVKVCSVWPRVAKLCSVWPIPIFGYGRSGQCLSWVADFILGTTT